MNNNFLVALLISGSTIFAAQSALAKKPIVENNQLLVKFKKNTSSHKIFSAHFSVGAMVVDSFTLPENLSVIEVPPGVSLEDAKNFYEESGLVAYAEPNYPLHINFTPPPKDPPSNPDDPKDPPSDPVIDPNYTEQWGLNNEGQTGGTADADINAPELWKQITGDKDIIIAVIDTGINYLHEDLKNNMWVNDKEIPGNNIDDDNNGVVDDVYGFNAVANNGDPMDDNMHGSHCAGIIAAEGGNTYGGIGVMQDAQLIACKFLDRRGSGSTAGAIACLDYLYKLKTRAENPVDIFATSNSWGGGMFSQALQDAIEAHKEAGILFVAAAGNEKRNNDTSGSYPANYPVANIISVAATDHKDGLASFSNYGEKTVHVGAPGVDIFSTALGQSYDTISGTSMATPFVTGLAGMIKAKNKDLDYIGVRNLIISGGTPVESLLGKTVSGRRIRAVDTDGTGSLTCDDQVVFGRLSPSKNNVFLPLGQNILLSALHINCDKANGGFDIIGSNGIGTLRPNDLGMDSDSASEDGLYTKSWQAIETGVYDFMFPGNDRVSITVFDNNLWKKYSYASEDFNYIEIDGENLNAEDESTSEVILPFNVPFAGDINGFNRLMIGSNGAITITDDKLIGYETSNLPAQGFLSFISPMWLDLDPSKLGGGVFVKVIGDAPYRKAVVDYKNVPRYGANIGADFQVVFFEDSSDIVFNYKKASFDNTSDNIPKEAIIGIQSGDGKFVQVNLAEDQITAEQSIRFTIEQ